MKKYVTPEMEIKSLVQNVTVANDEKPDGEYGNTAVMSAVNWWDAEGFKL